MKCTRLKSIFVFSNGSCFFSKNNKIKNKNIIILEKDSKNFKLVQIELKNFLLYKTKHIPY